MGFNGQAWRKTVVTIELYVERDGREIPVMLDFEVYPDSRGSRDRMGVPLEPDCEPSIELRDTSPEVDLSPDELRRAEERAWEKLADDYADSLAGEAEHQEEQRLKRKALREEL